MVTVELAIVAFVGSGYLRNCSQLPGWSQAVVVFFGLSIAAAAWILSALPWIILNLDVQGFENFYQAPLSSVIVLRRVPVWVMAVAQHIFFALGLIALVLGIVGIFA